MTMWENSSEDFTPPHAARPYAENESRPAS